MKNIRRSVATLLVIMVLSTSSFAIGIQPNPENEFDFMEYLFNFVLENFKQGIVDDEISREDLIEGAYRGIFETLDEHSVYFDEDEYEDFTTSTEGEFGGIGISVTKEGKYIKVISPIEGTPGHRAGIKPGDLIFKVDGEDISSWSLHEAVDVMRGNPGDKVTLTINRNEEILTFEIVREIIKIDVVEHEVLENEIGYIKLKQFNDEAYEEMREALFDLKSKNVESLIIDLRNNPGGYLDEVVDVADLFIDENKDIVHIDYETQQDIAYQTKNPDLFEDKIVVLVNEGSASASEILTGAIQDNNEGLVLGTTTYGKGTVQTLVKLANGGGMKLTIAEYMTSNKTKINGKGIEPDIEVLLEDTSSKEAIKKNFVPMNETRIVYYGERSLNVYGMQQRLNYLGYDLALDGAFGPNTLKALNAYQKNNQLPVTRYINPALVKALNASVNGPDLQIKDTQLEKAIEILSENE